MAEITFSSVFSVICDNIKARVKDKIFGEIFYSYFEEYDKSDVATDYTANKILSGRKAPTEKCKDFSGREKELRAFSEMLKAHDKVFLYGIGGIGKSEFVKKYISEHKKDYTNILYTTYSESVLRESAIHIFKC